MKKIFVFNCFIVLTFFCYSQEFPAPSNFYINFYYDFENNENINHYYFETPDTSGIESTLIGYKIYFNSYFEDVQEFVLIHTIYVTDYIDNTPYDGQYYVTAFYSEPDGESEPSNIVEAYLLLIDKDRNPGIKVYPNPTDGIFTVETRGDIKKIEIFNSNGVKILDFFNNKIDLSTYMHGLYFIKIEFDNEIITKKIILQ